MVKTRRMILQNSDVHLKNKIDLKKSKTTAKLDLNKKKTKIQLPSIEELMSLCRPFTVSIRRCNTFHTLMKKNEGKFLSWIVFQIKFIFICSIICLQLSYFEIVTGSKPLKIPSTILPLEQKPEKNESADEHSGHRSCRARKINPEEDKRKISFWFVSNNYMKHLDSVI